MHGASNPALHCRIFAATLFLALGIMAGTCQAQFFRDPVVGGVKIDAQGVLTNPEVSDMKELQAAWQKGLQKVPADLTKWTDLRFVSLRQIESQLADADAAQKPAPDAVRFLAGLQRVNYVLVYPERNDIVLAGPAEGWKVNQMGSVVGLSSNRPVLMLDDLMVALRAAEDSNRTGISCSIDPTPEGLERVGQLGPPPRAANGAQTVSTWGQRLEEALGPQTISVTGVPATSHFARVLVAADFRMKRLGMDFEPAPVNGMPSFLDLAKNRRSMENMMPRWWLEPMYEPLRRDLDGLAWELRGQGVRCLTEEAFLNDAGQKQVTGRTDATAQKWAELFTKKFDELAQEDSSFGELRNVMDLAVIGALLVKEGLLEKSGLDAPRLMQGEPLAEFPVPRSVPSQASFVRGGRGWLVSVSGGVQIFPWQVADKTEVAEDLAAVRPDQSSADRGWYWQR